LRIADCGLRNAVEPLLLMLAPYAPHLTEELWSKLGHERSILDEPWPPFDEAKATAGDVEIAVQINGRLRARLTLPRGLSQQDVLGRALGEATVQKFVDGHEIRKVVYVPDRLLNLVV
jgi:leucyl-tRNA synthetase